MLGYINIRLHRHDLEQVSLEQAIEISDFVRDNTYRSMMANDRQGLYDAIDGIGNHSEIEQIRIIDHNGRVAFSSDPHEAGNLIRRDSTQCIECHRGGEPPSLQKRFRIYEGRNDAAGRHRVLAVIAPILNKPECSNAACHAHPASQRILGVLDTGLSLKREDASLAQSTSLGGAAGCWAEAAASLCWSGSRFTACCTPRSSGCAREPSIWPRASWATRFPSNPPTSWERWPRLSTA